MPLEIIKYSAIFFGLYLSLELIKRNLAIDTIWTRKIAHFFSCIFAAYLVTLLDQTTYLSITVIFLVLFTISYQTKLLKSIHFKDEYNLGELYLPVGIITLAIFFYDAKMIMLSSLIILAIADSVCGLINHFKLRLTRRSTVIFFLLALIIQFSILYINHYPLDKSIFIGLASALIGAISERYAVNGLDNLSIPISIAMVLQLLL